MMQVMQRDDARTAPRGVSAIEYCEQLLHQWARWMRHASEVRGYPSRSCGIQCGGASKSLDELGDEMDAQLVRSMDAVIADLPHVERAAVHHQWLAAVWRLREPQSVVYRRAQQNIIAGMRRRGWWMGDAPVANVESQDKSTCLISRV